MAGEKTLGALLSESSVMIGAMNANAADLRHLEGRKATIEANKTTLEALNQRQEALKAESQSVSAEIKRVSDEQRKELTLIRKGLTAVYGKTQKLLEFGIKIRG